MIPKHVMTNSPHILRDFDHSISLLKSELVSMASMTRKNLENAYRSLMERNLELANSVIADDDEVDQYERLIDKLGMDILVKYHPLATDLRVVIASMKVSMNLERVSDHAVSIAKRAKKVIDHPELVEVNLIEPIYTLADHLLKDAIFSYNDNDGALGASLHERDKELDRFYKKATTTYSSRIEEGGARTQDYLHLIMIVRSLERIGDLATNIGEDVMYIHNAKDLRHLSQKDRKSLLDEL